TRPAAAAHQRTHRRACVSCVVVLEPTGMVARELPGDPPGARAAHQRPLQRILASRGNFVRTRPEAAQPVRNDVEVLVLAEGVERDPQTETLRQRDLLLHRLTGVELAIDVSRLQVLV